MAGAPSYTPSPGESTRLVPNLKEGFLQVRTPRFKLIHYPTSRQGRCSGVRPWHHDEAESGVVMPRNRGKHEQGLEAGDTPRLEGAADYFPS